MGAPDTGAPPHLAVFLGLKLQENRKKTGRKPEENQKKTKRKPKENQKKTEENRRKPEEKKTTAPPFGSGALQTREFSWSPVY